METHKQAVKRGKKSRASGVIFEKRVRLDLEEKGWIVDKWTNNVEFIKEIDAIMSPKMANHYLQCQINYLTNAVKGAFRGRLIPAKPKFVFNPIMKRRIMIGNSSGFPDFICFRSLSEKCIGVYELIGVESKMKGILDKLEKEKCTWLLDNNIFSKILIAKKTKVKNRVVIEYREFEVKDGKEVLG